jgi:hypothetical protein
VVFTDIRTEQTTAATDVILTVLGVGAAVYLQRFRGRAAWKTGVWSWVFVLMAFGAGLGAVIHGVVLRASVREFLWQPLYLSLAFVVVLVVVGAVYDWHGRRAAVRVLSVSVVVPPLFWLATYLGDYSFRAFVVFSIPAMVFSFVLYLKLALGRDRLQGAGWMAAAMFLTIAAGGIQASDFVCMTVVWPFDHNGVFHIVQAIGILAMIAGLKKGFAGRASGTGTS